MRNTVDNTFQKIPFLRFTLAFAIGIIVGNTIEIPGRILFPGLLVLLVSLLLLNKRYNYKRAPFFGFSILVFFLFLGTLIFNSYNTQPYFFEKGISLATVLESPQEKQNSYKALLKLSAITTGDSTFSTNEKVLVYFSKDEKAQILKPGIQIAINRAPQVVNNYGNPFEFDYKGFLENRRIYRQLYLNNDNWEVSKHTSHTLSVRAELIRERLLEIFHSQNLGANETEILSALTLGYKRDLDPETKRVFSAAGAMHILAVSGLHVGIIFLVFSLVFGFLKKQKTGRYVFVFSSVILLWGYAFITGLSPSVLRASTMFTIVIIGTNINRRSSIYNSLAASALFLLLINPNNLFEVGFQLSYCAVFGIVFLQPKLEELWPVKNKIVKFFWGLICVSIAAQMATFPLTTFYFNQFPIFFLLTNIIIIPAVMLLIPMGIALLLFSKIPFLSMILSFFVKWLIKGVYLVLQFIEALPHSTIDLSLSSSELVLLLSFLFFILVFIKNKRALFLQLAFSSMALFVVVILTKNIRQQNNREIFIFNNSNPTIQLITGKTNYVVSNQPIEKNDFIARQIETIKRKKRLNTPLYIRSTDLYEDQFLFIKNGLLFFEGKTIHLKTKNQSPPLVFFPDYVIVDENFKFDIPVTKAKTKIISTNYNLSKLNRDNLHSLKTDGTFHDKWKKATSNATYSKSSKSQAYLNNLYPFK